MGPGEKVEKIRDTSAAREVVCCVCLSVFVVEGSSCLSRQREQVGARPGRGKRKRTRDKAGMRREIRVRKSKGLAQHRTRPDDVKRTEPPEVLGLSFSLSLSLSRLSVASAGGGACKKREGRPKRISIDHRLGNEN